MEEKIQKSCCCHSDSADSCGAKAHVVHSDILSEENQAEKLSQEESDKKADCCCGRITERSEKEYKNLIHRLNRIEGQIRGIRGMVEKNCYCPDILTQVAAANAALNAFNRELLANHIKTCVVRDMHEGKEETIDELVTVLQKLMK